MKPISELIYERPDIWIRAVTLATNLTGCVYLHKAPLLDGTIYACGGKSYVPKPIPVKDLSDEYIESSIILNKRIIEGGNNSSYDIDRVKEHLKNLEDEKERRKNPGQKSTHHELFVPEGEMEWLLHEVGHWVAATHTERQVPNYGYNSGLLVNGLGKERELQSWGFEEIIFSPWGSSRNFASVTQRDGVIDTIHGPLPYFALRHAEKQIQALGIDIEEWRSVYAEWVNWRKLH